MQALFAQNARLRKTDFCGESRREPAAGATEFDGTSNNVSKLLLLTLVAGLFAGCSTTRPISDVALGAGGAYLGHELSSGDPLVTAAGAAGGVIASD